MSKFCPNCGSPLQDNEMFCGSCGCGINRLSNEGGSMQYQSYQNSGAIGTAWSVGSSKNRVNKVAYSVLAILLGGFGIHKFFSGKIMWGVIYILLSWSVVPSVLGLVEGITGLATNSDSNGNIYA